MTANLAAVIAGEEQRVAVIDTDIRSPGLHVLFGLSGTGAHDDEAAVRVTRGRDLRQPRDQSG
jgi:Mrp family chromosome partitioning ATPase